ncbi:MAG: hypothetical protein LUI02_00475, partial [Clostridiales bacterium]|nr:hypothetical protein [Clostridiales bacterium]
FKAHCDYYCIYESRDNGNLWGEMMRLHEKYAAMREENHSIDLDCSYIMTITRMLAIAYVAPVWKNIVRGKDPVRPLENLLLLSIRRPAASQA